MSAATKAGKGMLTKKSKLIDKRIRTRRADRAEKLARYRSKMSVGLKIPPKFVGAEKKVKPHPDLFWEFVALQDVMTELDRLAAIGIGLTAALPTSMRDALNISFPDVARLLNTSTATLERRLKNDTPLDLVASERLDRIARIANMAEGILGGREEVANWLVRPHPSLDWAEPLSLCETEIGARQVKRILSAIEWGNAA